MEELSYTSVLTAIFSFPHLLIQKVFVELSIEKSHAWCWGWSWQLSRPFSLGTPDPTATTQHKAEQASASCRHSRVQGFVPGLMLSRCLRRSSLSRGNDRVPSTVINGCRRQFCGAQRGFSGSERK
jgi:hypothetical protein